MYTLFPFPTKSTHKYLRYRTAWGTTVKHSRDGFE